MGSQRTGPESKSITSVRDGWRMLLTALAVTVAANSAPVLRASRQQLNIAAFSFEGHQHEAIDGIRKSRTDWGQLARSRRQVVQFKDVENSRFVAVVVDGEVTFYGASKKRS